MNRIALSFSLALSFALTSLVGCAAPTEEESDDQVAIETVDGELAPMRLGAGRTGYKPAVKRADILAGGGSCSGSLCQIGSSQWQCSGTGNCELISR